MVAMGALKGLEKYMDIYSSGFKAFVEIRKPEIKEIKPFACKQEI